MRPALRVLAEALRDGAAVTDDELAELAAAGRRESTDAQLLGELARRGKFILETAEPTAHLIGCATLRGCPDCDCGVGP